MADQDSPQEVAAKFLDKLKSSPFVMIGLMDGEHSEPMTAQIDDDQPNTLFFFAGRDNRIAKGGDAMAFIIGNEIYDHLEKVVDRFEDVANKVSGILIEQV